eukprot:CAMPEP_0184856050 /NCGR_PEP_ID=MMETSP0580-20130426/1210_1 /TAXON_ID=1118495 /ORGANISM="Dactyliosolen fragilissimus" /LENGTH=144 /DNA_ID=CAMNT_0027350819 /DNA_START=108 /DNA_END=542 /DNA_ORIENTATION=-
MNPTISSSIPVMRQAPDMMAYGPNGQNLASSAVEAHPVDRMQRSNGSSSLDIDAIRRLYGSALAMRLSTERDLASKVGGRLPGIDAHPDSNAMLESLTGEDLSLGFGDILNSRESLAESGIGEYGSGKVVDIGPHSAMEKRLGL